MTTVQDLGRWGWQARGVPVAGPMDPYAHRLANALVANPSGAATLEVTIVGPHLVCEDERLVAVAGADFEIDVDGQALPMNTPMLVPAGRRIRFGARRRGARAYVAFAGGVDVPLVLGSRATHVAGRMGGLEGRPLRAGDRLPLGRVSHSYVAPASTRMSGKRSYVASVSRRTSPSTPIRILPAGDLSDFPGDVLETLTASAYAVDPRSDRMGLRLNGARLARASSREMISNAVPIGALQVPPTGEPILLMADRQTTGGYPIVATVISADLGRAGQLAPGDHVRFDTCTRRDALAALIALERSFQAMESPSIP